MCPQCGSETTHGHRYETGEHGYHTVEDVWICEHCGEISTEEEMERANKEIRDE